MQGNLGFNPTVNIPKHGSFHSAILPKTADRDGSYLVHSVPTSRGRIPQRLSHASGTLAFRFCALHAEEPASQPQRTQGGFQECCRTQGWPMERDCTVPRISRPEMADCSQSIPQQLRGTLRAASKPSENSRPQTVASPGARFGCVHPTA